MEIKLMICCALGFLIAFEISVRRLRKKHKLAAVVVPIIPLLIFALVWGFMPMEINDVLCIGFFDCL